MMSLGRRFIGVGLGADGVGMLRLSAPGDRMESLDTRPGAGGMVIVGAWRLLGESVTSSLGRVQRCDMVEGCCPSLVIELEVYGVVV